MRRRPERVVLLGHPVRHSLSPVFQNAAIRAAGIAASYEALDVPPGELNATIQQLIDEGAAGNVTIPHKLQVRSLCDAVSAVAERTNAVNTFWIENGALRGDNTDVAGFDYAARALLDHEPGEQTVLLLGAGGAAAAVLAAVESWPGATVLVSARNSDRLMQLVQYFGRVASPAASLEAAAAAATLVVNATPVGLHGEDVPLDVRLLRRDAAVLDLVYRPGETALVRAARRVGLRAADGREMLLEQGARAFMQWFDVAPDKMMMRSALERAISAG